MGKKGLTELELLKKNNRHVFMLESKINTNEITIQDIDELLPGYLHINNVADLSMKYVSKGGCEMFERTNEDLVNNFDELSQLYSDFEFVAKTSYKSIFLFCQLKDYQSTFSFFERLRYKPYDDFELFCTDMKLLKGNKDLICITNPISKLNITTKKLNNLIQENKFFECNFEKFMTLSKREKEILKLIALGKQNKEISDLIFVSLNTLKTHRRHINKKLETNRIAELIKFAETFRLI